MDSAKIIENEFLKSDLLIKNSIKDLWDCKDIGNFNDLHAELVQLMLRQKYLIDELERCIYHIEKSKEKDWILSEIDAYKCQYESNFNNLKKATIYSKKIIAEESRRNLFSINSKITDDCKDNKSQDKKNIALKTANITEDMLRLRKLISEQVDQSVLSLQALERSSATLTEVNEEFKSMGSMINQSKNLLSKFGRREISDTVLIFLSFIFFYLSCLYVVWKRLF